MERGRDPYHIAYVSMTDMGRFINSNLVLVLIANRENISTFTKLFIKKTDDKWKSNEKLRRVPYN